MSKKVAQNGWHEIRDQHRMSHSQFIRRAKRRRALERGLVESIFQAESKRLSPDFQVAIDRFIAERATRATS